MKPKIVKSFDVSFVGKVFKLSDIGEFRIQRIPGENEFWPNHPSVDGGPVPSMGHLSNKRQDKLVAVKLDDPFQDEVLFCFKQGFDLNWIIDA